MQSSPYKIKALKEQFWQLSWHLAPPRTFFCFSTQANSKNNHDWSPAEFVLQMPWKALLNLSPTLQIHLFQSSVLPSSPKILTHGIKQVLSTQFPSLSHRVKLLLSHSFWLFYPRESMSWEKKKKELKLQCGEKNRDYLGGSCGIQCVVWEQVISPISSTHIFIFTMSNAYF